jgi:5-methylcytosine-specific restriction endonuclease McrA
MRLAFKLPEIKEKLKAGELTMTSIAKIETHSRQNRLNKNEILNIAKSAVNKSVREVERILVPDGKPAFIDKLRPVRTNVNLIQFEADDEFVNLLQELKQLNTNPAITTQEVLRQAIKTKIEVIKKNKGISLNKTSDKNTTDTKPIKSENKNEATTVLLRLTKAGALKNNHSFIKTPNLTASDNLKQSKHSRYTTKTSKQKLWDRSQQQCEFVSSITNQRCTARHGLQIEHIIPHAKNGASDYENLKILCAQHNRFNAIKEFPRLYSTKLF